MSECSVWRYVLATQVARRLSATALPYFGWGTIRIYGKGDCQPSGYFCLAASFDTDGRIITSSPCFQLTGVATWRVAVSWQESNRRKISSKLRPVLMG